jgi:hypothetical protein
MNKRWLLVGAAALALSGVSATRAYAADKEENEQKISFKDAPSAVRKTLKREANGQKIKTVDKEKLNGKIVYEADVEIDDHNYEIIVDTKGLLLSKKLDNEADEKSEAKSKESNEKDEAKEESGKKNAKEADEDDAKEHVKKASKDKEDEEDEAKASKKEKKEKEKDSDKEEEK